MTASQVESVVEVAERYYDSSEADQFYFNVWGGEDIHVGLYEQSVGENDDDSIAAAGRRTVDRLGSMLTRSMPDGINAGTRVLDIGAGYGGAARQLAKRFGCRVSCLNLSEIQNARNRSLSAEQGLAEHVEVLHGNFEEIPKPDHSYEVVWSQDAILHSGRRRKVLEEARRVLKPGGHFIFTDPMQSDDCPPGVLEPVLARIHLETLGSFQYYRQNLRELGMEEIECVDLTRELVQHYSRVRKELRDRYPEMVRLSSQAYVDRMIDGLGHWIEAGSKGYLAWGVLHFRLR